MQKKLTRLPYIFCYICAFVLGMKQLREPDMWWQLLTGRWMLENGEVTKSDMFSYTMEGTQWVNIKWLYEILIAFMEKGLGPHAVMLLQSLVNVAMVYFLLRILMLVSKHLGEQVSTLFSTVAVLLFLAISEFRMAGRPEMVSHLLVVVYMFILWQSKDFAWKKILWLIPLQCLWANMHEGYPVGMALIGMYIGGGVLSHLLDKDKGYLQASIRLGVVWLGMAAAVLINPNFVQLWQHTVEIFRQLSVNKYTTELFSIAQPEYWTIQGKVHIGLLTAVCLFWIVRIIQSRKNKDGLVLSPLLTGYLVSIPVMGYLSMTANRNIPFAQIVLLPSVPVMLLWLVKMLKLHNKNFYESLAKRTLLISTATGIIFYISIVNDSYYTFTKSPNKYGIHFNTINNPSAASEFIKTHKLKGPAFSDYFVSSYLLWDLYPDFKSYIDLRDLDIFPQAFFSEYIKLYNEPKRFYDLDSVYKFNYVVLSTSQLNTLQQMLYWGDGFNVVHVDPVAIILLRDTEENTPINRGPAAQNLFTWPQEAIDPGWAVALTTLFNPTVEYEDELPVNAAIHAGNYYNSVQNYRISLKLMRTPMITDLGDNPVALTTMGNAYMGDVNFTENKQEQQRKLDTARMCFEKSLRIEPEHGSAYLGLAGLSLKAGDFQATKDHLDQYLEYEKGSDYVYFSKGLCERNIWQQTSDNKMLEDAIESFEKAISLNERNDKSYLYIAEAYWAKGDRDKARAHMRKIMDRSVPWEEYEKKLLRNMSEKTGVQLYKSPLEIIDSSTLNHEGHNH